MENYERHKQKLAVFMKMCKELSTLSYDPKYKVSAIIITADYREVCAIGYNGGYKGGPNERSSLEHGNSGFLHAEENALFHLCKPYEIRHNLIMFCTHKPCSMCARRIVNSGIQKVIYENDYADSEAATDEIFNIGKTLCIKYDILNSSPQIMFDAKKV